MLTKFVFKTFEDKRLLEGQDVDQADRNGYLGNMEAGCGLGSLVLLLVLWVFNVM